MVPYFQAGQSFVVAKGNPKAINTTADLCGKSVAAETGTTEVDYVNGVGDYKGKGLSKACTDAGKAKIDMKEFPKDTDALSALLGGQVDAYFADTPPAAYYTIQHPDQFDLSGIPPLQPIKAGISVQSTSAWVLWSKVAALLGDEPTSFRPGKADPLADRQLRVQPARVGHVGDQPVEAAHVVLDDRQQPCAALVLGGREGDRSDSSGGPRAQARHRGTRGRPGNTQARPSACRTGRAPSSDTSAGVRGADARRRGPRAPRPARRGAPVRGRHRSGAPLLPA
jgi:hypothetical protein